VYLVYRIVAGVELPACCKLLRRALASWPEKMPKSSAGGKTPAGRFKRTRLLDEDDTR
jgi:hypothetical protein